jgi:hypothetical protein
MTSIRPRTLVAVSGFAAQIGSRTARTRGRSTSAMGSAPSSGNAWPRNDRIHSAACLLLVQLADMALACSTAHHSKVWPALAAATLAAARCFSGSMPSTTSALRWSSASARARERLTNGYGPSPISRRLPPRWYRNIQALEAGLTTDK